MLGRKTKGINIIQKVIELFQNAKKNLSAAVNMTMLYSYYEAGRMTIEEEQDGKGYSYDNLKLMRKFYQVYSKDSIGETSFPQSEKLLITKEGRKFYLSWSHYLILMRINKIEERKKKAKEFINALMILTPQEKEYQDVFERKEYKPELLFEDAAILENVKEHSMTLWKMNL